MAGSNTDEANGRVDLLKDEIAKLDAYEKTIDQHKQVIKGLVSTLNKYSAPRLPSKGVKLQLCSMSIVRKSLLRLCSGACRA